MFNFPQLIHPSLFECLSTVIQKKQSVSLLAFIVKTELLKGCKHIFKNVCGWGVGRKEKGVNGTGAREVTLSMILGKFRLSEFIYDISYNLF